LLDKKEIKSENKYCFVFSKNHKTKTSNFLKKIFSMTIKMSSGSLGEINTPYRTSYVNSDALGQPNACYATLAGYNSVARGTVHAPVAVTRGVTQRLQAVPVWGSMGYDALTHGQKYRCGGYYTIEGAYPDYSKNCGAYVQRACAGTIHHGHRK